MNLKSIHTKPAPKASVKPIVDKASDELKYKAWQYIEEWVKSPYARENFFHGRSESVLDEIVMFLYNLYTRPRLDSEKNRKSGKVGLAPIDDFDPAVTGANTPELADKSLRRTIKNFCIMKYPEIEKSHVAISGRTALTGDMGESGQSENDDFAIGKAMPGVSTNRADFDNMAEDDEQDAGYSDNDYFRKFKSLPREQQEAIIKKFGTGKHFEDPHVQELYKKLRQFVKKGTALGDSRINDEAENDGPKQGLTPDQWPTEVEDPNTGEMKPVEDIKKADSKKLKKSDFVTVVGKRK